MTPPAVFPVAPAPFVGRGRRVDAGACFDWLRQGWALFTIHPALWLGSTVLLLVGYLALAIVPLVGLFAANLLLPVLMAGQYDLCRRQSDGQNPGLADIFVGFRKNISALVMVGLLYASASLAVTLTVGILLSAGMAATAGGFGVYLGSLLLGLLLGIVLLVPVLMALVFAPALVFFHDMEAVPAMKASFNACTGNWLAFLVYGVILLVLLFFAALPVGLGFLLLVPVTAGAFYAAYRDIFPGT